jgi:putative ABC transport system permease protein
MRSLKRFFARTRNLMFHRRGDERLREEMEQHIALQTEENARAGMSPEEAHRQARLKFGADQTIRESYHAEEGLPFFENLLQDSRYALRQLRNSPGFALVTVVTLALGIGATTAIFTLVYSTLLGRLPFPRADRIIRIYDSRVKGESTGGLVGAPRFFDLQTRSRALESAGFYYFDKPTLIVGTSLPEAVNAAGVNADFWKVFGVKPLLGRTFNADDDKPNVSLTVVLSYSAWQRLFGGDPRVIGRQVTVEQRAATVVGVMPQTFDVPAKIDLWSAAQFDAGRFGAYRGEGTHFFNVVARIRPEVSLEQARGDLRRIGDQLQQQYPQSDGTWRFTCESLRDAWFGGIRPAMLAMMTASALLLLIACINVANLLLSRGTTREREVAVRRALGASAGRVAMQFLTESTLLALIGGGAGVLAALALVHGVAAGLPGRLGVPGAVEMNWPVLAFALLLSVATGIGFGLVPAVQKRKVPLNAVLKQGEARLGGATGNVLRSVLSAVQVGISLVLLVGASLLGQSVWNLLKSPLGFKPDHLLVFTLKLPWNSKPEEIRNFYDEVQRRIVALPGIKAAGQTDAPPAVDWHLRSNFDADWLPRTPSQPAINAEDRMVAGDFLEAMGMHLLAGRAFTQQDQIAKIAPVMVNEELVREYLNGAGALGRHLIVNGQEHEIIGMLANIRGTAGSIAKPPGPEVYWPADAAGGVVLRYFAVRSVVPPEQMIHAIREQVHQVDPRQAIGNVQTMDHLLNEAVTTQPQHDGAGFICGRRAPVGLYWNLWRCLLFCSSANTGNRSTRGIGRKPKSDCPAVYTPCHGFHVRRIAGGDRGGTGSYPIPTNAALWRHAGRSTPLRYINPDSVGYSPAGGASASPQGRKNRPDAGVAVGMIEGLT